MKKEIITIAGNLGSGKSSTANRLAELHDYRRASTGDFMRQMAASRGMTLDELGDLAKTDPSIDHELDDYTKKVGQDFKVILDSRLGFYFIPDSFKVFLKLSPKIAAERILKDKDINLNRQNESAEDFDTVEKIAKSVAERVESEKGRYRELYGIEDHMAPENFDLIVDTGLPEFNNNLEAVAQKIFEEYKKWLEN